jgi:peptidoglycan/xylan/chitin deacetylase (PgdA/CDA1 family)
VRRFLIVIVAVAAVLVFGITEAVHVWALRSYRGVSPICRVQTALPEVAMSFDDGPDEDYTPLVLRELTATHSTATFFVTGEHASSLPGLVDAIIASGNELGDHTWSHPDLTSLDEAEAFAEFARTADLLSSESVRLVRAPHGEISAATLRHLRAAGFVPIGWSVPLDHYIEGLGLSPHAAATTIARTVKPGDIVLAHDADDGEIDRHAAMETIELLLPLLRERGISVVSVGTLLDDGSPVLATPRPWFWQSGFSCPAR